MSDPDVDDVAFLTGENVRKQVFYGEGPTSKRYGQVTCTKCQSIAIVGVVLVVLLAVALIAAFARPARSCRPCDGSSQAPATSGTTEETSTAHYPSSLWPDVRLPSFEMPLLYSLFLHPNLTTFIYHGQVNITFQISQSSSFVVLHAKELNITSLSAYEDGRTIVSVKNYILLDQNQQLYISFEETLKNNINYTLKIDFHHALEEKLEGFYLSSYKTSDGAKRYLATTHFEPTAARSAFPCFDEPNMKAVFQLQMVHDSDHVVLSNTKVQTTTPYGDGLKLTVFKPTVKMSTYLVAFVVCDFDSIRNMTSTNIEVAVYAPKEQIGQAHLALNIAIEVLQYYENFFNISYPLEKLDMIAIPDFGAGAMENWGLITYRMTAILYDDNESSVSDQEYVATVVAHEIAHQWFGNLVTMKWWNDLWLNEGFASFMEYFSINEIHPSWQVMDNFIKRAPQSALELDSLETSHPIESNVADSSAIEALFDDISYNKGSSIIYMLENFLGRDQLRKGLSAYLKKYSFSNAETDDLWNSLTKQVSLSSQIDVKAVMEKWTKQKGYPLVSVSLKGTTVTISQKRFLLAPPNDDEADMADISPFRYQWDVPVTYITDQDATEKLQWLHKPNDTFSIPNGVKWIKVNVNQSGFYRVLYDTELWAALTLTLNDNAKALNPKDRSNLIFDAFTLMRTGILPSSTAMNLTTYLKNDEDYLPWSTAIAELTYIERLMWESSGLPYLQKYVKTLLSPVLVKLGWKDKVNDSHSTLKLRSAVVDAAVHFLIPEAIDMAKQFFSNWTNNNISIPSSIRAAVYAGAIKSGHQEEWNSLWKLLHETQIPSEQNLLRHVLSATLDPWQLSQYLNYSLDKEKVKSQDTVSVICSVSGNRLGVLEAWRFVKSNWNQLFKEFGSGSFAIADLIDCVTSSFSTQFDYDEVKNFFANIDVGSGKQALQQSLEKIRANIRWRDKAEYSSIQWLQTAVAM